MKLFKLLQQELIPPKNTVKSANDKQTLIGDPHRIDSAKPATSIQRHATEQQSQL